MWRTAAIRSCSPRLSPDDAQDERDRFMASLEAGLKNAVQAVYDLEDMELAVTSLPDRDTRTSILLYEASEGGAGVLRHLAEDPAALARVARQALELCHFDPDTGEDRHRAPGAVEDCEAACYDCLMSYSNQPDHAALDRMLIRDYLLSLAGASVATSPSAASRGEHLQMLLNLTQSDLERRVAQGRARPQLPAPRHRPEASSRDWVPPGLPLRGRSGGRSTWTDRTTSTRIDRAGIAHFDDKLMLAGWTSIRFDVDDIEGWIEIIKQQPINLRDRCLMPHAVGTLVRARERDWVVLPGSDEELLLLRPIGGTEDETTGILPMLGNRGTGPVRLARSGNGGRPPIRPAPARRSPTRFSVLGRAVPLLRFHRRRAPALPVGAPSHGAPPRSGPTPDR